MKKGSICMDGKFGRLFTQMYKITVETRKGNIQQVDCHGKFTQLFDAQV
jgi:hypothetical protein